MSAPPTLTPIQQTSPYVLPATGTIANIISTAVPYGVYLGSTEFLSGAAAQVSYTYKMLGGDVLDIELTEQNVYTSYELAVLEYSYIINNHQAVNTLSDFLGATTGTFDHNGVLQSGALSSSLSGTHVALKYPSFQFSYAKKISDGLAQAAALGDGRVYSASVSMVADQQVYDLQKVVQDASVDGTSGFGSVFTGSVNNKRIEIRKVYYKSNAAMWRFYGYYGGLNVVGNLNTYGQYSDDSTFEVIPTWQNKSQAMAFEDSMYTRASHYSYEIMDNYLKIYPSPSSPFDFINPSKIWFDFTIPKEAWESDSTRLDGKDGINNYNTLPFANIPYQNINSMGKQWIRNYALAITKGMLAQVRGKFGAIPLPGDSVTLNASELASQSQTEKDALKVELKELLDKLTYAALVEADTKMVDEAKTLQTSVPMKIFVG
jgi:hypothetical protein